MTKYTYKTIYNSLCYVWVVVDKYGRVVYEATTEADAETWIKKHPWPEDIE